VYKETYYFPHDSNAGRDPKCAALIKDFGMEGYGIYWSIIEILHEQKNGKLEKFPKLIDGLAFELNIQNEALLQVIEALVKQYNLLQEDENWIWSNRVIENLQERNIKRQHKIEAGRLGGIKSGISRKTKLENEAVLQANEALPEGTNQRKGKERKRKEINKDVQNDLFELFWKVYPKKKSKGTAEKAFNKITPDEQLLATMVAKIEQAKKSREWLKNGGEYIPHPSSWLNARGWEDEIESKVIGEQKSSHIGSNEKLVDLNAYLKAQDAIFGK